MNRQQRRNANSKQNQKELEREAKRKQRNRNTLEHIYNFLTASIEDPKKYIMTSNRIYLLRCLGNIMDSVINDIDGVMHLSDFDEPSKKLMKNINKDMDSLLDRLRDYSIKNFGEARALDGFSSDDEYNDLCQVSLSLQDLMERYLIYFIDPDDHWRLGELDKFFDNVVSKEAMKIKSENTKKELIKLYGEKLEQLKKILELD